MPVLESNRVDAAVAVKNILLATDFAPCSDAALPLVESIAARYGSKVFIAHVLSPENYMPLATSGSANPWPEDCAAILGAVRSAASERLAAIVRSPDMRGLDSEVLLLEGEIVDRLTEAVQKLGVDLIVTGTHGRHGVNKFVMGSVTEGLGRVAPCPMLVVGPRILPEHRRGKAIRRILYATDFAPESSSAFEYAISLAEEHHAKLTILTVLKAEDSRVDSTAFRSARGRLRNLTPDQAVAESRCQIDYTVDFGAPAETILKNAAHEESDMIVLGGRALNHSGRVTYKVVSEALCAVLTVPAHYLEKM